MQVNCRDRRGAIAGEVEKARSPVIRDTAFVVYLESSETPADVVVDLLPSILLSATEGRGT